MERLTFRCACCRQVLPRNPRVKDQQYCGAAKCQKARKAKWQREKMRTDQEYRTSQQEGQRLWQQNNPDYWQRYRSNNSDYRHRNRLLQKVRDSRRRRRHQATKDDLAKMDTLESILNDNTGIYFISPDPGNLAKMDALPVKIIPLTVR